MKISAIARCGLCSDRGKNLPAQYFEGEGLSTKSHELIRKQEHAIFSHSA